jgi:outer membrane protein TolC
MKTTSIFFLLITPLFISSIIPQNDNVKPEVIVGILLDGRWEGDKTALDELILQCNELLSGEFNIKFPDNKLLSGDWDLDKTNSNLLQLLNDPEVDIVIAYGEISSRLAVFTPDLQKPVIAPAAINAKLQGMPVKNGTSGINNLNYLSFTSNLNNQIPAFKKLYDFSKVAMLINQNYYGSQKFIRDTIESRIEKNIESVDVEFVPVGFNYEAVLESVSPNIEAVIIQPIRFLSYQQIDDLISRFKEKGIPAFSIFDERYVQGEALAGFVPRDFFQRHSRRIALNIQAILLGENAGDLSVTIPIVDEFVINMKTAEELKLFPSWSLVNNSRLINTIEKKAERVLSLIGAITNAKQFNLDYLAEQMRIESGKMNVNIARSNFLPQVKTSITGTLIDNYRASNSSGQLAEKTISGGLTLDQLIYDVDAWTNFDINSLNQELRIYELQLAELDLINTTSVSYFEVLLAETLEMINKNNLNLSNSNMEIARYRVKVGSANMTEIYRWESEIANSLRNVIQANANRNLAEINLNRLLNFPAEESLDLDENSMDELIDIVTSDRVMKYYKNKWDFKIFRSFMVEESFSHSPELKILNKAIEVQERISTAATAQFFLPTIGLQGQLNNTFYRDGAGSEFNPVTIPGIGQFQIGAPPKDFSWNVGLNISLPLFEGAGRFAEVEQASIELKKLHFQKESLQDQLEQSVRSALHLSGSSYAGMIQANISAESSLKNLDIVINMYSQGFASITELLDAQNAALLAELLATSSQFDFLIDMMNVQRSIGEFIFTYDVNERQAFIIRLEEYFELNNNN